MNKDKRKHIALSEDTANQFKLIAKLKGMTHEGLMKYLIEKETK